MDAPLNLSNRLTTSDDNELGPSEYGAKRYWNDKYLEEKESFNETKDVGEIWFGPECVERMIEWMDESPLVDKSHTVLDLGCGNAFTLVELYKRGYTSLVGVDYCPAAIELAKKVTAQENANMTLEVGNILVDASPLPCLQRQYDIIIDKGTYDAISLNPYDPGSFSRTYARNVARLLKDDGLFILVSRNWRPQHLLTHLRQSFSLYCQVPTDDLPEEENRPGQRALTLVMLVLRKKTNS